MKNFLILHYGFEMPTPEEMDAWNKWFEFDCRQAGRQGASPWRTRNLKRRDQGTSIWERLHHRLHGHQSRKP